MANKISTLINQVESGETIAKIYKKCNADIFYFKPQLIVSILTKNHGILATMNYIVNIIKLNISAVRRKRFTDTEKTINMFQKINRDRSS